MGAILLINRFVSFLRLSSEKGQDFLRPWDGKQDSILPGIPVGDLPEDLLLSISWFGYTM